MIDQLHLETLRAIFRLSVSSWVWSFSANVNFERPALADIDTDKFNFLSMVSDKYLSTLGYLFATTG